MAKKVSLYGILTAVCIVLGYVEHLIPYDFIAPGVKIGLANTVALLLVALRDIKGAFAVNIARILLSSLLFSSPQTLMYSLPSGVISLIVMALLIKITSTKKISFIGFSIIGAFTHNIIQLIIAALMLGVGVFYYSPILLLSAAVSGFLTGNTVNIILKRIKK